VEAWIFNNITTISISDVFFEAGPCNLILKAAQVSRVKSCVQSKIGQEFH